MPLLLAYLALQSKDITLTTRGETVAALLRAASSSSGVSMEAGSTTADEIVIVSVKGVSDEEFRKRLAEAVGAGWRRDGSTWRLTRSADQFHAQELAERRLKVQEVREGVEALKKRVAAQPPFDEAAARALANRVGVLYNKYHGHLSDAGGLNESIAMVPETPAGRFSIEAVSRLSPEQVADVGQGDRIVYSTNPTRMQRKFPGDLTKAFQRYVAEQGLYVKALQNVKESEGWANSWSPLLSRTAPDMPAGMIMSTAHSPYNNSLTVQVSLTDQEGNYISGAQSLLDVDAKPEAAKPMKEGLVPLTPSAKRLWDAMGELNKGKTFIDDTTLIGELEHMDEHDPLSYLAADGVLDLAEGSNLIACVPDDAFVDPMFSAVDKDGKLNLGTFSKWVVVNCETRTDHGWMVVSPKYPVRARELRADRKVMGSFFREARRNDGASLDQVFDYVAKMPARYMETLSPFMAFFLLPDLNGVIDDRNIEMLRVIGRLQPQQRQGLLAGQPVLAKNMSAASLADLNKLTFRADSPVRISIRNAPGVPAPAFRESTKTEVTCVLPDGVPPEAKLSVQGYEFDGVIVDSGSGSFSNYRPMNAYQLAWTMQQGEQADPKDVRQRVQFDKFRFGHTHNLMLDLALTETIGMHGQVSENRYSRTKPAVTYDQLPSAFRDAVDKAKTQVRRDRAPQDKAKVPPPL